MEFGAGGVLDSRLPTQEGGWTDAAVEPPHGHAFVQACKGGHQGCPLATNQCILPYTTSPFTKCRRATPTSTSRASPNTASALRLTLSEAQKAQGL